MPEILRKDGVYADEWVTLGLAPDAAPEAPLPGGPVLVSLPFWQSHRAQLLKRGDPTGVWLAPADDPAVLTAEDLKTAALIGVQFPKFTDGRGYSTAVLLRRLGYAGELRAFGDVGRDQLFYLARVGFDSFALKPGADPHDALASFKDFSLTYQGSVDDRVPLYRRRSAESPQP